MSRLTYRDGTVPHINEKGNYVAAYSDRAMRDVISKLADYEDAEEQGLLVRLPCKVGDTVYRVTKSRVILDEVVDDIVMPEFYTRTQEGLRGLDAMWNEFGKTVFLTREEAEAALKGERKDV